MIYRFIALILLFLFSPILILVGFLKLIIDGQSFIFIQERIGQNRRPFKVFKIQTMKNGKITSFGRILRKTGIDELPQLVNIIKGEMSFFGPRPLLQSDIIRLNWTQEYYSIRWNVKPGITGLGQITPICHKKATWLMDKYYCENKSLCLDLYIIFKTCRILIGAKGDRR